MRLQIRLMRRMREQSWRILPDFTKGVQWWWWPIGFLRYVMLTISWCSMVVVWWSLETTAR